MNWVTRYRRPDPISGTLSAGLAVGTLGRRAAIAAAAVLAAAPVHAGTLAESSDVAMTKRVRDTDLGVRATVRYFPDVWTIEMSHQTLETGELVEVFGEGSEGRFEAEITQGALDEYSAEAFMREAVMVVCPSADPAIVAAAGVEIDGLYLRLTAQCPGIDAKVRK